MQTILSLTCQQRFNTKIDSSGLNLGKEERKASLRKTGGAFHLRKAQKRFHLVNLSRRDYFSTLRTKLDWSDKPH